MGFPVCCSDLYFSKLLIHLLTFLSVMRKSITLILSFLGFKDFLESEIPYNDGIEPENEVQSVSAALIRELLPVVKYSDLTDDPPESCAVCLYEFNEDDEVRLLMNCRHIYHKCCVDRWMDHNQKTCPLCRTVFLPDDMQEVFNERLWLAAGVPEFYGELPPDLDGY